MLFRSVDADRPLLRPPVRAPRQRPVAAGDVVDVGRITEEAEADLDLLAYLERNAVFPETRLHILAVDRLSGAVTARTGKGAEVRVEKRSAALIFVRPVSSAPRTAGAGVERDGTRRP